MQHFKDIILHFSGVALASFCSSEKGIIDSECSRHMTVNMSYLSEYEDIDGGYVAFEGDPKGGKITGKGKICTGKLDFEDVYFVKELKFNLFSVSQTCDKKNGILFTNTECVVLSPNFKLLDESQVLLKVPRQDNMYSVDLKNVVPSGAIKDETSGILKAFITGIENLIDHKVMIIRCDNGTEFKNKIMNEFYEMKGIRKKFSVARAPQQNGRKPALSFMRLLRCLVTILNTLDHIGRGPTWLFDIDTLTDSMNYKPVVVGNQTNSNAGTKENIDAGQAGKKTLPDQEYILLPLWTKDSLFSSTSKQSPNDGFKPSGEEEKQDAESTGNEVPRQESQEQDTTVNNTNNLIAISLTVNTTGIQDSAVDENIVYGCANDPNMPDLEDTNIFKDSHEDVFSVEADFNNMESTYQVSPIPTTRVHNDHLVKQIIGDLYSAPQTKRMTKSVTNHGMISFVSQRINHEHLNSCLFACFLSQIEPTRVAKALTDLDWVEAMQEELLQNKKYEKGIVIKSKARVEKEVYVCQPLGFEDPDHPDKVYKVVKALYGLHQAPKSLDKYVTKVLRKFNLTDVKPANTSVDTEKHLVKDADGDDVDVHLYRSMIGSLMYLTASRQDI
nr:ribonuclease H-like domain-containing protein [Tanacetum cinerariifolium]